jgi:hypothetical protein
MVIGNLVPLVFDVQNEIYNRAGIDFGSLSHLETLGLIQFNNISGFRYLKLPKKVTAYYYGKTVELTLPADVDNQIDVGRAQFTRAGRELAPVCGSSPVGGFFEFVCERWARLSLLPKNELPSSPQPT